MSPLVFAYSFTQTLHAEKDYKRINLEIFLAKELNRKRYKMTFRWGKTTCVILFIVFALSKVIDGGSVLVSFYVELNALVCV